MKNRVEAWELFDIPGAEEAAEELDRALGRAMRVLKFELQDGAGEFEAFRTAKMTLWFELAMQREYGAYDTPVREKAWEFLTEEAAPLLGYDFPEDLTDDLNAWGRFYLF